MQKQAPRVQPRQLGILAALYAGAAAAGWLCARLNVPLAWMVGPLVVAAATAATRGSLPIPVWSRWAGQLAVASAVALNLTPAALAAVLANIVPMLLSAIAVIGFSLGLASVIIRAGGIDRATALFASLPGGPVEMAVLADTHGGRAGLVAFSQTLRIAAIVLVIPPFLILLGADFRDLAALPVTVAPLGLALVLGAALITSVAFRFLRIANPFFLGPLVGVGLLTVLGGPTSAVPGPLIAVAQVMLGVSLGAMFDRSIIRSAKTFILHSAMISALLIGLGLGLAALFAVVLGQSFQVLALANAPGSVTEMAVTAKGMSLDASFVTAYHVVRIFLIVPAAEAIFRTYVRLSDWIERRGPGG